MTESQAMLDSKTYVQKDDFESLEKRILEAKEMTAEFVRKYPLASVALASGVGYLIAKLFYQRR